LKDKRIVILGSTGSLGRQALEVIDELDELCVCGLSGGKNWKLLLEQARRSRPQHVAIADADAAEHLRKELPSEIEVLSGDDASCRLVRSCRPDVVLSGVVGAQGLAPALAAIESRATLAIANKEPLVMAGELVVPAARSAGVAVIPVDSEHSGIFQCLAAGRRTDVRRVVMTASGGALRDWDDDAAETAGIDDALCHPTWSMGPKITVDSATLLNKALEVVEAHWLFDLPPEQIEVVLHSESIVHSYVEFCDGSVIAQLAAPDMKMPIAFALCWPDRPRREVAPLDLASVDRLTFRPLSGRFARAVSLGYEVIRRGGTAGAVLNSANEAAVEAFLAGKITFGRIVPLVEDVLYRAEIEKHVTLESLRAADAWARERVAEAIGEEGVVPVQQARAAGEE